MIGMPWKGATHEQHDEGRERSVAVCVDLPGWHEASRPVHPGGEHNGGKGSFAH